jgi:ectoine hydroxylase-related dioxygenase (phytanoyl-CoA dioxygenase family)
MFYDARSGAPIHGFRSALRGGLVAEHPYVTEDIKQTFARDGVVHLPQVLDADWLDLIETGVRRNLLSPGPYMTRAFPDSDREIYIDYLNAGTIPEFRILLQDSPIVDIVATVLGSESLWLFFEQVWVKAGGRSRRTPWHQDAPVWITEGSQVCGFWITLDPVGADESLEFVRGSHRGPLYNGIKFDPDNETSPYYPDSDWPTLPDIQADRSPWDIVSFPNTPGDVVMFHPAMLHGGGASDNERRTLSLRFFGDDVTYAPRPGRSSPPFPGVASVLKPGEPLRSSWFPQVLPRPNSIW